MWHLNKNDTWKVIPQWSQTSEDWTRNKVGTEDLVSICEKNFEVVTFDITFSASGKVMTLSLRILEVLWNATMAYAYLILFNADPVNA